VPRAMDGQPTKKRGKSFDQPPQEKAQPWVHAR